MDDDELGLSDFAERSYMREVRAEMQALLREVEASRAGREELLRRLDAWDGGSRAAESD